MILKDGNGIKQFMLLTSHLLNAVKHLPTCNCHRTRKIVIFHSLVCKSPSLTGEAPPPKETPAPSTPPPPEPAAPAKETPSEIPTTPPPGTCYRIHRVLRPAKSLIMYMSTLCLLLANIQCTFSK